MSVETVWTEDTIRDLGAFTGLQTAAKIFGISRGVAYEMAAAGTFPVPVLKIGTRGWRVPVGPILTAAGFAAPVPAPDQPDHAANSDLTDPPRRASINVVKSPAHPTKRNHSDGR